MEGMPAVRGDWIVDRRGSGRLLYTLNFFQGASLEKEKTERARDWLLAWMALLLCSITSERRVNSAWSALLEAKVTTYICW